MRIFKTLSLTFLFVTLGAASSAAQTTPATDVQSTISSELLATTLADHESQVDQQRAQLADLLSRDDVRATALDRGIDMGEVESAAAGLTDAQVQTVAPMVAALQENGLGSITIGVGALILILLILILVT